MKKLIFFIALLLSVASFGQTKTNIPVGSIGTISTYRDATGADSALYIPSGCGAPAINMLHYMTAKRGSNLYKDTCNNKLYSYNPSSNTWTAGLTTEVDPVFTGATVADIPALMAYPGTATTLFCADTLRGGYFRKIYLPTIQDDNVIYFAATAFGAGWHFVRDITQANIQKLTWAPTYKRNDSIFWDSGANLIIQNIKNRYGGRGTLIIPVKSSDYLFNYPIHDSSSIDIVADEGAVMHNVSKDFFYGLNVTLGSFQQTDFGSHNVQTGFEDLNCQMYPMANYPLGQQYVVLLNDTSVAHIKPGDLIMIRKGPYPIPVGPGSVDSTGELNSSEFLDIRGVTSIDTLNRRLQLDEAINTDSVWIYPGTHDTIYTLSVTKLIGGRPANSKYWSTVNSYMIRDAHIYGGTWISDSSSWTTRTATYHCRFSGMIIKMSKYGIGLNCSTQTTYDNMNILCRMRQIEHAEGGYASIFDNIQIDKIAPDPRPYFENMVVLQKYDQLLNSRFTNNTTTEGTPLYLRGGNIVFGNHFSGRFTNFWFTMINGGNDVLNNKFYAVDSLLSKGIISGNITVNGTPTQQVTSNTRIEGNEFHGKLAGSTGAHPVADLLGNNIIVSHNSFFTDTTNNYLIFTGVNNEVSFNYLKDNRGYNFSASTDNNKFFGNNYDGGNGYFANINVNAPLVVTNSNTGQTISFDTTTYNFHSKGYYDLQYFPLAGGTTTGIGGLGFMGLNQQSATPSTPANGVRLYAQTNMLKVLGTNGFYFAINASANSQDVIITAPTANGQMATQNSTTTFTNKDLSSATNTFRAWVNNDISATANIDASKLGTGIVSNTEFNYLDGVTSAIQTQINNKVNISDTANMLLHYVTQGIISWPGTIYSTSTTATFSGHTLTFSPALANQSNYTLLGRGSGTGTPSFLASIDSNWIPTLHSENYYNTKYITSLSGYVNAIAGENYLSKSGSTITANAVNLAGSNVAGALPETKGGTNQTTYSTGDLLYASGSNTLSKLAIGGVNQTLHVVGGVPVWRDTTANSGAVASVSNADGSLTISPTTGSVVASVNLANSNIWTGIQTFSRATSNATLNASVFRPTSASSAGTPVRYSSSLIFRTRVWNTGGTPANNDDDFQFEARGVSGNPTSASLYLMSNLNGGSFTDVAQWTSGGNLIVGTANNIQGTATNNNAATGNLGEEINSAQSTYTNYTTTATYQNITSITLTAGDWDLSAFFTYSSNSATITAASNAIFVISTTTASAAGATEGVNIDYVPQAALLGTSKFTDGIPSYRVSISGTTTYYLNTQATFTIGNPQFVGSIRARRER